jgi:hypothetical protein
MTRGLAGDRQLDAKRLAHQDRRRRSPGAYDNDRAYRKYGESGTFPVIRLHGAGGVEQFFVGGGRRKGRGGLY